MSEPKLTEDGVKHQFCTIKGCGERHWALGYCGKHYKRFKKWGDPNIIGPHAGGRKKGSFFYSAEQVLGNYRPGDTQESYTNRTGISCTVIHDRFGGWNKFKQKVRENCEQSGTT